MAIRSATPTDKYLGQKIRGLRNQQGISQGELGTKLGISFQQIQKYEKGINRVGAVRLQQMAEFFGVSVADLLPINGNSKTAKLSNVDRLAATRDGSKLINSFVKIKDENLRGALVELARRFEGL